LSTVRIPKINQKGVPLVVPYLFEVDSNAQILKALDCFQSPIPPNCFKRTLFSEEYFLEMYQSSCYLRSRKNRLFCTPVRFGFGIYVDKEALSKADIYVNDGVRLRTMEIRYGGEPIVCAFSSIGLDIYFLDVYKTDIDASELPDLMRLLYTLSYSTRDQGFGLSLTTAVVKGPKPEEKIIFSRAELDRYVEFINSDKPKNNVSQSCRPTEDSEDDRLMTDDEYEVYKGISR